MYLGGLGGFAGWGVVHAGYGVSCVSSTCSVGSVRTYLPRLARARPVGIREWLPRQPPPIVHSSADWFRSFLLVARAGHAWRVAWIRSLSLASRPARVCACEPGCITDYGSHTRDEETEPPAEVLSPNVPTALCVVLFFSVRHVRRRVAAPPSPPLHVTPCAPPFMRVPASSASLPAVCPSMRHVLLILIYAAVLRRAACGARHATLCRR